MGLSREIICFRYPGGDVENGFNEGRTKRKRPWRR